MHCDIAGNGQYVTIGHIYDEPVLLILQDVPVKTTGQLETLVSYQTLFLLK